MRRDDLNNHNVLGQLIPIVMFEFEQSDEGSLAN